MQYFEKTWWMSCFFFDREKTDARTHTHPLTHTLTKILAERVSRENQQRKSEQRETHNTERDILERYSRERDKAERVNRESDSGERDRQTERKIKRKLSTL